jgi:hypothetical protein
MAEAQDNRSSADKRRAPPPAFDPERPLLVQPWREFEGRGWVAVHYVAGGITTTVKVELVARVLQQEADPRDSDGKVFVRAAEAKARIIDANLWAPRGAKKKGSGVAVVQLPLRSICKKDFEGSDESLLSRARSVANTLGDQTAAGRIGSLNLSRVGKETFAQWWDGAGADRKARVLSDQKHYDSLTAEDKERLNTVLSNCPFRGNAAVPAKEAEAEASAHPAAQPQGDEGKPSKPNKAKKGKPSSN